MGELGSLQPPCVSNAWRDRKAGALSHQGDVACTYAHKCLHIQGTHMCRHKQHTGPRAQTYIQCTHRHTHTHNTHAHEASLCTAEGCATHPHQVLLTRSWSSLMTVSCLAHCPKRFFRSRKAHILQSLIRCMEASSEGHWCGGGGPFPSSSSSSYDS